MRWPRVETETLPWSPAPGTYPRRAVKRMPREYEAAVVPMIANQQLTLTEVTRALVERATVEAVRFDTTDAHRVVPFTPLLLRSESTASSRIEQLTSSARKVLEAEATGRGRGNAALIAANTRQMEAAVARARANVDGIVEMHQILLADSAPEIAGVLRGAQVWIGGSDYSPAGAMFVPPHQRHLTELMVDLGEFMARDDLPALAQAAIAHAQFETIHPFADGNGRTGRALVHVVLRERGLTTSSALPLSAGLLTDTAAYFAALDAYRGGDVDRIVQLFARAAIDVAERGSWLAAELVAVREEWNEQLTARADALAWRVLDLLLQRPVLTTAAVSTEFGVSAETARNALDRLEADGIVISAQLDKRQRGWRSPDVLALLDEFAEASGRRG
ncbi:GntR family transcriptional regulator [Corynebacterium sp. zg912]|uniref:Fic family protein n=1 Tax=Corynebacterium wankanglinii TaxID=2735136 RepID=A0A7H0K9X8_9CORY|nr:Fic family protein [Corynebacterium wankanglinii]MCR5928585.1 GntR family transcriptional regulator [Corynebacterium sp. zg912]QNP94094.1 Fic family protein [Corynebacterium wankanglinii]